MVKPHVVGDQNGPVQQLQQRRADFIKRGRIGDHGVADTGEVLDQRRNPRARVDQRAPARHLLTVFHAHGGYFGDTAIQRVAAGGFKV